MPTLAPVLNALANNALNGPQAARYGGAKRYSFHNKSLLPFPVRLLPVTEKACCHLHLKL